MDTADMKTEERAISIESIRDAIRILDSAPLHFDYVNEMNLIQLSNRAPIAHLAIERGLKTLIGEKGRLTIDNLKDKHGHDLRKLLGELVKDDKGSADYLAKAFNVAVKFYGHNVNVEGLTQFGSLERYLERAGDSAAFEAFRYWAIDETSRSHPALSRISLPLHREILYALQGLFGTSRDTVSDRVEREIANRMMDLSCDADELKQQQSAYCYEEWFKHRTSSRDALEQAVRQEFAIIEGDKFVSHHLFSAYTELGNSKDPAVRFFIQRLSDMPKGSQKRNPDAVPTMRWCNSQRTFAQVETPTGTCLGLIQRTDDSKWAVTPLGNTTAGPQFAAVLQDAKEYLINRLTKEITVTLDGESRHLRIVDLYDSFLQPIPVTGQKAWNDLVSQPFRYELEFWDSNHGLQKGVTVSIHGQGAWPRHFVAIVTTVEQHRVSLADRCA